MTRSQKKEIDLLDIWKILFKKKWIIIALAAVLMIVSGVRSFMKTPMYRATSTILIEEPNSAMIDIKEMLEFTPYYNQNFIGTYFNTQLKLLTSRSLAERVVRNMDLVNRTEFQSSKSPRRGVIQTIKGIFSFGWLKKKPDAVEGPLEPIRNLEYESFLAYMILGGLSIEPVVETRLVNLHFISEYPVLATDIINTLAEEFIDYSIEMRFEATRQASEFLGEQISEFRSLLATKEQELQKYGAEKQILILQENEDAVVTKFAELSSAYTKAQIERFNKEAEYRELKNLRVGSIPSYVSNPVIQSLRTEYIKLKSDYEEKSKVFKPDYPEMIQLRSRLDNTQLALENELQKAVDSAYSEYREAFNKERSLGAELENQRLAVVKTNNNSILYNSLNIEAKNIRTLLNNLMTRQNETLVSARLKGLKTSNIKIIDTALVPESSIPRNTSRNMMIALFLGLMLGVGTAFFLEYLDNTVKDPEEIEKLVDLPSLGVVPFVSPNGAKKQSAHRSGYYGYYGNGDNETNRKHAADARDVELINHLFPTLAISEDYRTIRTSILFSHADSPPQVINVSSAFPQEGKSATISNLAVSFSQLNKKVLLIDGDLRRPRLHKIFKVRNEEGLSNYLTGKISFENSLQITAIKNLWILPSGPNPPNPAELLDSNKMKELIAAAKEKFDITLIDSPPILAVIDPIILSSFSDGTAIVVRPGKTTKKALIKAVSEVKKTSGMIIGIIFNESKPKKGRSYNDQSYHGYMDQYTEVK